MAPVARAIAEPTAQQMPKRGDFGGRAAVHRRAWTGISTFDTIALPKLMKSRSWRWLGVEDLCPRIRASPPVGRIETRVKIRARRALFGRYRE
jgi:hypothetical protein